jgi:diguanylate cyclase (GGDEF)-like protein/PAS domain S-box-containing protein
VADTWGTAGIDYWLAWQAAARDERGVSVNNAEMQLGRLLVEFPDLVVVLDSGANVIWANSLAERQFGLALDDSIGVSALEFVHPDDLELAARSLATVRGKRIGNAIEVRLSTPSGWRLFELIGTPVNWFEEGALLFCIRDLTERRRFEVARDEIAMFRMLVHNAATITMLISPSGHISSASGALTRMLGHDPELVENELLADLVVEDDRAKLSSAIERALGGATATLPEVVEVHLVKHDSDEVVPFELTLVNLIDDPTVGGLVVTAHDVSERAAKDRELRNTLSLLQATLDSTADGILVVDNMGKITGFNNRFAEMWRISDQLLASRDDSEAIAYVLDQLINPQDFTAKVEELYTRPESESNDMIEFRDGRVFERYSRPQLVEGAVVGRVWSFRDVTERTRLEAELAHQAFHDALTGLANKALFRDRLTHAVARLETSGLQLAVLFLDVDNFKTVNDSLGHSRGDLLLGIVSETLVGCMRNSDTVARLGGDEFAVLIEDLADHSEAIQVAENILTALRRPVSLGTKDVVATVSIGIRFGTPGCTSEELLRDADLAMYMAKENGKDRYEEFRDRMHTTVMERLELEADFRQGVINEDLVVHYQPIVNLDSKRIVGFEALVRWQHPTRGLLRPEAFLAFAEEAGFMGAVDCFVLTRACGQILRWQREGLVAPDASISVNLSARDMVETGIDRAVRILLSESGFDPSNLIVEITESAMMNDIDAAVRELRSLKALGLRIAIDDFGTGYSSLAYLQRLPIDILKIDRSFVATLSEDTESVTLVNAIIRMAEALGHTTIAEGIERATQGNILRQLGCHLGQGYLLGPPLDAASMETILRTSQRPHTTLRHPRARPRQESLPA